ncbi:hypothetical protein PF005_g33095 [Phytophthora fragariae]|uniref:Uncharacterized protein n=1 Tax=Phytophthora fragariae TaxID=53985 RepID=A0A6A3PLH1_9STRA|nr:hypothetical protein PF007_g32818 [Phytophthora fragariae]KAE9156757.1 hypothetical protein PF005_g33095 [Phytophthora fragariae]KAE9157519.1 hypothetical protein PF002_g33359 [Phytophthora fragariae]
MMTRQRCPNDDARVVAAIALGFLGSCSCCWPAPPTSSTRSVLTSTSSSLAAVVKCKDLASAVNRWSVASPPT